MTSSVVCTGPIPNQQVIPGVNWSFETLKARRYFLTGSRGDTGSQVSSAIIKDQLKALGASCVGEIHVGVDGAGVSELVAAIKNATPDIVLSTVVGDANKPFYEQLARAGLTPGKLPVLSFTIGEDELRELPVKEMIGDYAAWSYFESIDSPVNRAFVQRFKARYGAERTTSDSIVAAYNGVNLWRRRSRKSARKQHPRCAPRCGDRAAKRPRASSRWTPKPCTRGGPSTWARFVRTASSTWSGAWRSPCGRCPIQSSAAVHSGMRSWNSCARPAVSAVSRRANPPNRCGQLAAKAPGGGLLPRPRGRPAANSNGGSREHTPTGYRRRQYEPADRLPVQIC